jgi:hypothetical protein
MKDGGRPRRIDHEFVRKLKADPSVSPLRPPNPGGRPRKHFADRAATPVERVRAGKLNRPSPRLSQGLLDTIVEALLKAGAGVEAVAAAVAAYKEWELAQRPQGRPRVHADRRAARRAWAQNAKAKEAAAQYAASNEDAYIPEATRRAAAVPMVPPDSFAYAPADNLRVRLIHASRGNCDPQADVAPIEALIEQGCDLDLDVVPIVAREVPELPRPLPQCTAATTLP